MIKLRNIGIIFSLFIISIFLNVGEKDSPLNNQKFIQYGGLWGEIGNTTISTGPKSPSFQDSWMKD